MSEFKYDISQLLNLTLGVSDKLIRFDEIPTDEPQDPEIVYTINGPINVSKGEIISSLGTPVVAPIKFIGGNYNVYRDGLIEQLELEDYTLPFTSISDFQRAKKVTETAISGGTGTVNELYAFEDWKINIAGLIIGENGEYPEEQLTQLLRYESLADSIKVEGVMFERLSIYEILIQDITVKQIKGFPDVAAFGLKCKSVEPVELILK